MKAAELSMKSRGEALTEMVEGEPLDVLVIGGGIVGAGVALDAVTRGLKVGIVEARDWASGTSSRSSKLIHGGLRYLEMLDFGLVREALKERALLLQRIAPHLVRPVPFVYPITRRGWERSYVAAGLALYDSMGITPRRSRGVPHHRHLSHKQTLRLFPSLKPTAMVGAVQYWDAQMDDARYAMTVVRTAASYGALVANGAKVVALLRDSGVTRARVRDVVGDRDLVITARVVVNATGVWTSDVDGLSGAPAPTQVRASKGIHLVVARDRIDGKSGLILRTKKSVLFVIPWDEHWIVGTTDTDWDLDRAHPSASAADIDYVLDEVNRSLTVKLTRDDVVGVYVGLRPLLVGGAAETAKLSREHVVTRPSPGLVTVAGGKYTTYRVMAADAVDSVVGKLGRDVSSVTESIALVGADGYVGLKARTQAFAAQFALDERTIKRLLGRYGDLISELLSVADEDPAWLQPVEGASGYLRAEIRYAASHEGAQHLDDVLARRTHISIEERDRGLLAAEAAADILAEILGWDDNRTAAELAAYRSRIEAEVKSQHQADDEAADRVRRSAIELVDVS